MDACSRKYRVTTSETDLYWNRGYKYAANAGKLAKLLEKLDETGVEVYRIESKGENLAGDIRYFTLNAVDLGVILNSASKEA